MDIHYRIYKVLVDGVPLPSTISIEALSNCYIEKQKQNFINEKIQKGIIKKDSKVDFIFKFCNR